MKGFGKFFLSGLTFVLIQFLAFDSAFAQGAKRKPAPKKPVATKKPVAVKKPVVDLNLPKVTQIDLPGLQNLLKREGENPKPLLINFWATWCDPCREEFPDLVKIDTEFKGKIDFITISLDDLAEIEREVPKFLAQMKAEMPAYLLKTPDETAAISTVSTSWQGALPFTILFNAKGETAYSRMGIVKPDILKAELEKVIVTDNSAQDTKREKTAESDNSNQIVNQQIINLPISGDNYTYEKGVEEAKRDISNGKLLIKRFGLTIGYTPVVLKELSEKYRIGIAEHGCLVTAGFIEYVRGYNEIARAEIKRKYGDKPLKILDR